VEEGDDLCITLYTQYKYKSSPIGYFIVLSPVSLQFRKKGQTGAKKKKLKLVETTGGGGVKLVGYSRHNSMREG
jgi:hypothetical protein